MPCLTLRDITRRIQRVRPHLTEADIVAIVHEVRAEAGRRGGKATSEAKRLAASANGRKGGRPPKKRRKTGKPNVEFSGTPAALSPEAPLERRVGRQR